MSKKSIYGAHFQLLTYIYDATMYIFSLGCTNMYDNYGKNMCALRHDRNISDSFSKWRRQLVQLWHVVYISATVAISEAATAKIMVLTKTDMSFPGQAT